jgi:hypothetical protein
MVKFYSPPGEPRRVAYVPVAAALPAQQAGRAVPRPLRRLGVLFCNGLSTPMSG